MEEWNQAMGEDDYGVGLGKFLKLMSLRMHFKPLFIFNLKLQLGLTLKHLYFLI